VSELVVNESNIECQPKVWSDALIIEEYESDSENEYVSTPRKEQETPSFANQQVKTPRETMEALGERGVAVDSLKQTHTRETAKLAALTDAIAESLAGIHEKERHVAKIDLND
ncbi:hypothetical protein Tco_0987600, partial [Tanacetum coccineum]